MNSKLTITLFTCSIIANSSAFAMLTDNIDADGIHEQSSSSSTLPVANDLLKRPESPDFERVLNETLGRMRLEEDNKNSLR